MGNSVVSIGDFAFDGCSGLTNVTIPNSVTSIGYGPFYRCSGLTSVMIGNSVTNIPRYAFDDCSVLTNIAVNAMSLSYASTGGVLFNQTLTTLVRCPEGLAGSYAVPNTTTSIRDDAFLNCLKLTNVVIANSVTSIGNEAFYVCSGLRNVTIGISVTNLGNSAFYSCSQLTSLMIPNGVTSIGQYAFNGCSALRSVTMGNSVTSIGDYAFLSCSSLKNMTIPNSVTRIGTYAFEYCHGLTNVTIGDGVTNFGSSAFYDCTSLHQTYFQGNAPTVNGGAGSADNTLFSCETGTAYYLPGTSGWGTTFGGWPTVLWNSQVQTTNNGFGIKTNRFGFNLTGTTNSPVVVEACTNLGGVWSPLFSGNITNGSIYFSDPQWTNYPGRFYRLRSP